MWKYSALVFFCLCAFCGMAQVGDSAFAIRKGNVLAIRHTLKNRETLPMLAQRYYTDLVSIEAFNKFDEKKKLAVGDFVYIPLTSDNFYCHKQPLETTDITNLYYKVGEKDNMTMIINYFPAKRGETPMTKDELRMLNDMHGYNLTTDQALFIGWLRMMPRDSEHVARGIGYPAPAKKVARNIDTVKHYFGGLDTAYKSETADGANALTEKGTAVFFDKPGKNTMYYAFHNGTPRNTVVKISNPNNNKTIFAKVIGPVPDTKNFANCIIGISSAAKEDLGISENRAWVELSYPAN